MKLMPLNPAIIFDYFNLQSFIDFAQGKIVVNGVDVAELGNFQLSEHVMTGMQRCLKGFGVDLTKSAAEQDRIARDNMANAQTYFTKALGLMSSTYGHIFNSMEPDIVPEDIIQQNRFFFAMIPSIGRSDEERESLGKISIASYLQGMVKTLGDGKGGTKEETLDNLPIDVSVPSGFMIDELAAAFPPGYVTTVYTQGRSSGISAWVGSQDIPGLKKANEKDTLQIWSNALIKYVGRTEDAEDTPKWFGSLAGESYKLVSQGYSEKDGDLGPKRRKNIAASYQKTADLELKHLKALDTGQFYFFYRGVMRLVATFYHGLDENRDYVADWRLNVLIPVLAPTPEEMAINSEIVVKRQLMLQRVDDLTNPDIPADENEWFDILPNDSATQIAQLASLKDIDLMVAELAGDVKKLGSESDEADEALPVFGLDASFDQQESNVDLSSGSASDEPLHEFPIDEQSKTDDLPAFQSTEMSKRDTVSAQSTFEYDPAAILNLDEIEKGMGDILEALALSAPVAEPEIGIRQKLVEKLTYFMADPEQAIQKTSDDEENLKEAIKKISNSF